MKAEQQYIDLFTHYEDLDCAGIAAAVDECCRVQRLWLIWNGWAFRR